MRFRRGKMNQGVKNYLLGCLSAMALILSGCADNNSIGPVPTDDGGVPAITKELAMRVAADEIANLRANGPDCGWSADAKVIDAYDIYLGSLENKAYFECKVIDGGADAGYVLVTANKSDLLIPESSPHGKTLTEFYREKCGSEEIKVIRFDWFTSAAVGSNGEVLAYKGFYSNPDKTMNTREMTLDEVVAAIQTMKDSYSSGVFPLYSPEQLAGYYTESEKPAALAKTTGEWRDISSSLKNTFPDGNHTPRWTQWGPGGAGPIGCGPTAWAILYGYWAQFKGKNALFEYPLSGRTASGYTRDADIWNCMTYTADKMGTIQTDDWGLTWTWDMPKGNQYAEHRGYRCSVTRDRGTEYSKFDKINGYISNDKPCILTIGSNSAIANHYVVVEKCRKSQYKYAFIWHDRNVHYFVNYGWGEPSKWICVRDWGLNQNPVTSAFSAYMVNFGDPSTKTGITLRSYNNYYLCAENGGGADVNVNRTSAGSWETFRIIDFNGGDLCNGDEVNIVTSDGAHYIRAVNGGGSTVDAVASAPYGWETLTIFKDFGTQNSGVIHSGDGVFFKTFATEYWITAQNGGGGAVSATRTIGGNWERFTITGNF
jgi:hypothetical protein